MAREIYVNLPVKDLPRSKKFFAELGFEFHKDFTNDQGAGMILGPGMYAMLLQEEFFKTFTSKKVVDAKSSTEVLVCIALGSKAEVDTMVAKAKKAGGLVPKEAVDHGFMYQHGFEDIDGHIWEVIANGQQK